MAEAVVPTSDNRLHHCVVDGSGGNDDMPVLVATLQVLGFFIYNFVTNFVLEPTYQTCFTSTLQKLKQDPRITVRLGNDIVGK